MTDLSTSAGIPLEAALTVNNIRELRALRSASGRPEDIEKSIAAARGRLADVEAMLPGVYAKFFAMAMGDASEEEVAAAESNAADARGLAPLLRRLIAKLEADLAEVRKRETLEDLATLRATAERSDAAAAEAWRKHYEPAALAIRKLLIDLKEALDAATAYERKRGQVIDRGELSAEEVPPPELATEALFGGDPVTQMVQLPSAAGLLRDEAIWRPKDILRDTWRQARADHERNAAKVAARRARK